MLNRLPNSSRAALLAACLVGLGHGPAQAGSTVDFSVNLPDGVVNTPYSSDLTSLYAAAGHPGIFDFFLSSGSLPPGETFSAQGVDPMVLAGIPTAPGSFTFYTVDFPGGGIVYNIKNVEKVGVAVPGPATWALLLTAFFGLAVIGVRRTATRA